VTEAMKHRLVGTAVLVALGVIAWPVIFDTSPVREISQRSQIPRQPPLERFSIEEPVPPALPPAPDSAAQRAAQTSQTEAQREEEAARLAPAEAKPVSRAATDASGLPVQWAVQLGVFGQLQNAQDIKRRAEQAGFHAILQSVRGADGVQYRVYVDPKLDRAAAVARAAEVERKLAVKGYVTRYYP
jgi:DedD protein